MIIHAAMLKKHIELTNTRLTNIVSNASSIMVVKKAKASSEKPAGQWNEANIFVRGNVMTTFVNGVYQNTGVTEQKEGFIGLQSEGNNIEFRNVTVTPLD